MRATPLSGIGGHLGEKEGMGRASGVSGSHEGQRPVPHPTWQTISQALGQDGPHWREGTLK